jgi:spore maturation protein CgeB
MDIVFLGLSITSSWGNGHAVTYRGLVRELSRSGHRVTFLERDLPWYAENRDLPRPAWGRTELYADLEELQARFTPLVAGADLVVVGSYVPQGIAVGEWVVSTARATTAFYDIDTPVTLARLAEGSCEYLSRALVPRYQLYLSFTGGPTLRRIERELGARAARPLYCSADPEQYRPEPREPRWDLAYLGTYSGDRQPALERLLLEPARRWPEGRFAVAGPQYPADLEWPRNVVRAEHLAPPQHVPFYNAQRFTLNVTRKDMVEAGYSPSVRLFEAASCGTPIVSDVWPGIETFFVPGEEILLARSGEEALAAVRHTPEPERRRIAEAGRTRVLRQHTAAHRARELERYVP